MDLTTAPSVIDPRSNLAVCDVVVTASGADALPSSPPRIQRRAVPTPRSIPGVDLMVLLDTAAAVAVLLAVLVGTNHERMAEGIDSFLSMRVTLKNVLFLAALVTAWPTIFLTHRVLFGE